MHIYLGRHPEDKVANWLNGLVGEGGRVFRFDEVCGLTGPGGDDPWVRQSLGDLVVVLHDGYNWEKRPPEEDPYASQLVSQHGAMSWNEMFTPLLCAPFPALLGE
jgi:hypothetical protein